MSQLSPSYVEAINAAHARCVALDDAFREVVIEKVNAVREVGLMLSSAKSALRHGQWLACFGDKSEIGFVFGERTAQSYMRFAAALPEKVERLPDAIATLTQFMRATGALPPATPNDGHRRDHNPFAAFLDGVGKIQHTIAAWRSEGPIADWPADRRAQAKAQLEPLVEVYREL